MVTPEACLGKLFLVNDCQTVIRKLYCDKRATAQDLVFPQEEADTRMFPHPTHASQQRYEITVIKVPDTDVGVLEVYYIRQISGSPILATGRGNKRRFIDISGIFQNYGGNTCEALPGLRAFTGCESVRAFSGNGKQSAIKVIYLKMKGSVKQ